MITIYNEEKIWALYESSQNSAIQRLDQLKVFNGRTPTFAGLSGWVFEQTIQYCFKRELKAIKIKQPIEISEQVAIGSRLKVDLLINTVAIEIKMSGLFSPQDIQKYKSYRQIVNGKKFTYLFLSGGERYLPYRRGITKVMGKNNAFFLDTPGDWNRFIARLTDLLV